jgi:annexin A7/11
MQGVGTDEKRIIKEIIGLTNAQRQLVKERYKVMYGQSLESDLKSELNDEFEDIIVALLESSIDFDANCLKNAISVN